ncbi:MAG: DUF1415 domain-containing protein [Porticoccaceae bacterium]|nr:DUF1415 domain-containing protein [Porticoccaceae bacterium]
MMLESAAKTLRNDDIVTQVRQWLETLVVGLNLCPFAKRELVKDRVRFSVSAASDEWQLMADLEDELKLLEENPVIETTVLIHPQVLVDFSAYNQFLNLADRLLDQLKLRGIFQIASFHPQYVFAGSNANDVENFTNRAPYPLLHLLREASLERAIANYADAELIPERNMALMRELGRNRLEALLRSCMASNNSEN